MTPTNTTAELALVPADTVVEANGEGKALALEAGGPRTFVVGMEITESQEQQSLELSVWGSADGQGWGEMPVIKLPQRFYVGTAQMVLDLTQRPEVKFLRARWS
ncbi:MAG: hypothetical protein ACE5HB_01885 [Terriglobia bacterium]